MRPSSFRYLYRQHSVYMTTEWAYTFDVHIGAIYTILVISFLVCHSEDELGYWLGTPFYLVAEDGTADALTTRTKVPERGLTRPQQRRERCQCVLDATPLLEPT
jgi:hypothetical protein